MGFEATLQNHPKFGAEQSFDVNSALETEQTLREATVFSQSQHPVEAQSSLQQQSQQLGNLPFSPKRSIWEAHYSTL